MITEYYHSQEKPKLQSIFIVLLLTVSITLFILTTSHSESIQFGNVAVFFDIKTDVDINQINIQLDENDKRAFEDSGEMVFWQVYPGKHRINATYEAPSGLTVLSLDISVLPNLTTRITLTKINQSLDLVADGFADQTGPLLLFYKDQITSFAGKLDNGPGLFTGEIKSQSVPDQIDTRLLNNRYSYDGLSLSRLMSDNNLRPGNSQLPEFALVNLGDPFAGDPGSDVSFTSTFDKATGTTYQYQNGNYGAQTHEGYGTLLFPANYGQAYLGISYDKLDDAFPRYNKKSVLPENGLKNLELSSGISLKFFNLLNTDTRFIYKKIERDYYIHSYLFNPDHSPREELEFYNGSVSAFGWLNQTTFLKTSFGLKGEENKYGDGQLFDDLQAYQRPFADPEGEYYNIFWAIDTIIDPSTDDTTIAPHYNDYFERSHLRSLSLSTFAQKIINQTTSVDLLIDWNSTKVRSYQNYKTTYDYQQTSHLNNIGFDKFADKLVDGDLFGDIPNPKSLNLALTFNKLFENGGIKASVNRISFDPGYLTLKDYSDPFLGGGTLSSSQLTKASTKSKIGLKVGAMLSANSRTDFFFNYSITYSQPSYNYLYTDYNFFENRYTSGLAFLFSFPDLELIKSNKFVAGTRIKYNLINFTLAFATDNRTNLPVWTLTEPAVPISYFTYQSIGESKSDDIIFIAESGKSMFVSGKLLFLLYRTSEPLHGNDLQWSIIQSGSEYIVKDTRTSYKSSGLIQFRPDALLKSSGGFSELLKRVSASLSYIYKSGNRYTRTTPAAVATMYNVLLMPKEEVDDSKIRDLFELNLSIKANLITRDKQNITFGLEIINLTDRENWLRVYSATGLPDEDDYLTSSYGQSEPAEFKDLYRLKLNDPNNYGSPRTFKAEVIISF